MVVGWCEVPVPPRHFDRNCLCLPVLPPTPCGLAPVAQVHWQRWRRRVLELSVINTENIQFIHE